MFDEGAIGKRYDKLTADRETFLSRARAAASLTLPFLINGEGHSQGQAKADPYQSVGAQGVTTLSAKLLLALLPPNEPFFRYRYHVPDTKRGEAEFVMSQIEKRIMDYIDDSGHRVAFSMALRQLIAAGNACLYFNPEDLKMKAYRLDRYVVKRDPMGNLLELITKEDVSPEMLPEKFKKHLEQQGKLKGDEKTLSVYTQIKRVGKQWVGKQEVCGEVVPKSTKKYPSGRLPYIVLRYSQLDGEDYGRGLVEEMMGDLKSCESLTRSIVQGAAAAAKIIFLVKPNGLTKIKSLQTAANGAYIVGQEGDVSTLKLDKTGDFSIAQQTLDKIERRVAQAFLMNSSVQRKGERVTAEEIRLLANELESALGGAYSLLSQELQKPYIILLQHHLTRKKLIPALPKDVKPVITTGTAALGRSSDLNKLNAYIELLQKLGDEGLKRTDITDLLDRAAAALGIDSLNKDERTVEQEQEQQGQQQDQQAMQEALVKSAPNMVSGMMQE